MRNPPKQYTGLGNGRTPRRFVVGLLEPSRSRLLLGFVLERGSLAQPRQRVLVPGGTVLLPFLSGDAALLTGGGLLRLHALALALSIGLGHASSVRVLRPDRPLRRNPSADDLISDLSGVLGDTAASGGRTSGTDPGRRSAARS